MYMYICMYIYMYNRKNPKKNFGGVAAMSSPDRKVCIYMYKTKNGEKQKNKSDSNAALYHMHRR